MITTDVSSALAAFLTSLNQQDPKFVQELVNHRVLVNNEDLDVVVPAELDPTQAGLVGVLNGFLDSIDQPRIRFIEETGGAILAFEPVDTPFVTFTTVQGVEVQVDNRVPAKEIKQLKTFMETPGVTQALVNYSATITRLPEGVNLTLISAPGVPVHELDALKAHIDEAKVDADCTIVVNYEVQFSGRVPLIQA